MIAVTMGDPNGVGPEIALKAFADGQTNEPWLLVGDLSVVEYAQRRLGLSIPVRRVSNLSEAEAGQLNLLDVGAIGGEALRPGEVDAKAGGAALEYIRRATELAISKSVEAVVTLPVNKEAVRLSHPGFTGHTEYIAGLCGVERYTMMLASDKLIVTHVSTHVALKEAISRVTTERVLEVIDLTYEALSRFLRQPRIAVAGLNPHAGEHGSFGDEDENEIAPAIRRAAARGLIVSGPEAPDTVFHRAAAGAFDAVVCMYHDQGHIPMKLLGFDVGVNVTIGLPIIRTSVDHGTAFDIAYKGTAKTTSFIAAFQFAQKLLGRAS
ncbi:MAG TPA: 4-hydroxythreonine-4-phosphate dehydrogenase PdxA [Spirochaetia bacterium]|nr:4-hydroxythreonine-4-phosphate dehydrogenase PdxA [Spirochaetia bacterium]